MTAAVYKARISLDVMQVAGSADEARQVLAGMTLTEILEETDGGMMIASGLLRSAPEIVPAEQLRDELIAIGNDGTFFDIELEDSQHDDGNA